MSTDVHTPRFGSSAWPTCVQVATCAGIGSGILEFMPLASLDATQHNRMEDEDEAGGDVGPLRLATVRCVTLEEVLDQLGLQRVSFLAVDVAGAELSVLESIDYSKVL